MKGGLESSRIELRYCGLKIQHSTRLETKAWQVFLELCLYPRDSHWVWRAVKGTYPPSGKEDASILMRRLWLTSNLMARHSSVMHRLALLISQVQTGTTFSPQRLESNHAHIQTSVSVEVSVVRPMLPPNVMKGGLESSRVELRYCRLKIQHS